MKEITAIELQKQGGAWLAAARKWMQNNAINGDSVTWGSDDRLRLDPTVRRLEEFASYVAAAAINDHGLLDEMLRCHESNKVGDE